MAYVCACATHLRAHKNSILSQLINHSVVHSTQGTVVTQATIDGEYNKLLQQTEEFLVELQSRHEQQRVEEEEAEKMRKIKEEQVKTGDRFSVVYDVISCFHRNERDVDARRRLQSYVNSKRKWRGREREKKKKREGESRRKRIGECEPLHLQCAAVLMRVPL